VAIDTASFRDLHDDFGGTCREFLAGLPSRNPVMTVASAFSGRTRLPGLWDGVNRLATGSPLAPPRPVSIEVSLPDVRARARAAFLGFALGDALGAPVEFMTRGEIVARHGVLRDMVGGGWLRLEPGAVTDDTEMSLHLARSLVACGQLALPDLAARFAAWLRSGPADVGNTVRRGIRRYLLDGSFSGPEQPGDGGNGAAMRFLPVALATLGDPLRLEADVVAQARFTHRHPLSDAACIHLGTLLHMACLARSRAQLLRASEAWLAFFPAFSFAPYRGLATGYVVDTVQTVLHGFFTTRGFEECLVGVVNQGGDADTTGAIAGALAGAFYGPAELPARWLQRLDRQVRLQIESLIDPLIELSPLFRRGSASPSAGPR
jgi:ADP-ribosyl-[dinitrogen reductase] hydrolase